MNTKQIKEIICKYTDDAELYIRTWDNDLDNCQIVSKEEIISELNEWLEEQSDGEPFEPITDIDDAISIYMNERDINHYNLI